MLLYIYNKKYPHKDQHDQDLMIMLKMKMMMMMMMIGYTCSNKIYFLLIEKQKIRQ